jgi:hypothetical protein
MYGPLSYPGGASEAELFLLDFLHLYVHVPVPYEEVGDTWYV